MLVRIAIIVIVLAGAGIAAWMAFAPLEAAVEPQTTAVARGDIQQTVLASGALEASSVTSVGAEVSGRIDNVDVKLGDTVKKGDAIAEIDSLDQENAVKSAEASLANMKAQLRAKAADVTQAQLALDRANKLAPQKLVSDADLEAAQATLESAQSGVDSLTAQISQASLAVDSANLNLSRTKIIAPVSGTVVAVLVTEGQSVNAAQSAPTIVKLAELDTMIIKAQISEADVTRAKAGQGAYFTILGEPDNRIDAKLLSIEPAPDAIATDDSGISSTDSAVYYNGLFAVDNPDHKLRIAMTAQVTIVVNESKDVLSLPSALLGTPNRKGLYFVRVYDPATRQSTPTEVKVGLNNNITAEILGGLKEGDLVVAGRSSGTAGASAPATSGRGGGRGGFRGAGALGL
jgi:macrolide-specific efflux system membrane fusion protein